MLWLVLATALVGVPADLSHDIETCKGAVEERLEACERLVARPDLDADHAAKAWHNIAQVRWFRQDLKGALEAYSQALHVNPRYLHAFDERAQLYWKLENYEKAVADFTSALDIDPTDVRQQANRGIVRLMVGDRVRAFRDLNSALEHSARSAECLVMRGRGYLLVGDAKAARADLEEAVRKDDKSAAGWGYLGDALTGFDDRKAKDAYDKSLALELNVAWLINRSSVERSLGRTDDALKDLSRALEIEPQNAIALYDRGEAEISLGARADALRDVREALRIQSFPAAHAALGRLLFEDGQAVNAIESLDAAIRMVPDYGYALAYRGIAHSAIGDWPNAKADCERALELKQPLSQRNTAICRDLAEGKH